MLGNAFSKSAILGLGLALGGNLPGADEPYVWRNVAVGGGGFVTSVEFHPTERGLSYARTDVGGAYRWDEKDGHWAPLLDWLGQAEWNWQGVESLALDPTDSNRVYLAVGTYTLPVPEVGNGAILRSADRGKTWQIARLPFKLGGNESGRGSGERLAVDPNFPSLLYFGTRRDGLWQSGDHGETWSRTATWPDVPDDSIKHRQEPGGRFNPLAQAVGVVWVRIDRSSGKPGEPTPVVYAAVSRAGESIFRSTNAGKTWEPLPNQPTKLRPTNAALAPDGTLYVTYADGPGPSRMADGAVWKFERKSGAWTELTPEKPAAPDRTFGYAGVCVDPSDANTLLVTTWSRATPCDEIFRSIDGGKTWAPLMATATWDHSSAPYTSTMTHHWMSDPEIDPFNRDRIVFNTGYGLWASTNATKAGPAQPAHWVFFNNGLEETVPLALISPPEGAHLISGLGDIDGFVHDDFSVSPQSGRFSAPGYKNTEWLDYAAAKPLTLVRTGTTYHDDRILAAISEDGGRTWAALPTEPPHPNDRKRFTTGPIAISADAKTIVWTPTGGAPFFSTDRGQTWHEAPLAPNMRVVADRVEPETFYSYNSQQGTLHLSTDGGRSFAKIQSNLALPLKRTGHFDFGGLAAVPGRAGEVWLATGAQLYRFTKQGRQKIELPDFSEAAAVGFGKAAPGADHPAVFVVAKYRGRHGIFRSDDAGSTWVRITDDEHQFGSAARLTGDPRVYGRVYFCTGGRGIIYGERAETPAAAKLYRIQKFGPQRAPSSNREVCGCPNQSKSASQLAPKLSTEEYNVGQKMNPSLPNAKSAYSPDVRSKIKRLVAERGLCGLANDTKWNEFIDAMRARSWHPSYRFKCVDGPVSRWDVEWFYHLPFPFISVEWFDVAFIQEEKKHQLVAPKVTDHSSWIEDILNKAGLDYQKGRSMIRIFGYSPKSMDFFDE